MARFIYSIMSIQLESIELTIKFSSNLKAFSEISFLFVKWAGSSTALCAYDVYCFGKVLLGMVTGKLDISASSDTQIKEWFG